MPCTAHRGGHEKKPLCGPHSGGACSWQLSAFSWRQHICQAQPPGDLPRGLLHVVRQRIGCISGFRECLPTQPCHTISCTTHWRAPNVPYTPEVQQQQWPPPLPARHRRQGLDCPTPANGWSRQHHLLDSFGK